MSITYDKKFLKWYNTLNTARIRKHALKSALFYSLSMPFLMFIVHLIAKNNKTGNLSLVYYFLMFILYFLLMYFAKIWEIKRMKKTYDESIEHWKKTDPSYLEGIKYDKLAE